MTPYEVLNRAIEFGNTELENFKVNKDYQDTLSIVLSSLFRKIIELSDGVRTCAEKGLRGPAEINFRGLIEAYLAFKYITEDSSTSLQRAIAYKINYHKLQLEAVTNLKREVELNDDQKKHFDQLSEIHEKEIQKEEYADVLVEYDKLHKKDKRGFLPKWYSLYDGPGSINQLAKHLEKNDESDKQLMATLYSSLSTGAHNYLALRDLLVSVDMHMTLKSVRYTFDANRDDFNLIPIRSLLTSSIAKFTEVLYPEYSKELYEFLNGIRKYLVY